MAHQHTILLADDNASQLALMEIMLGQEDYCIIRASDGKEVLEQLRNHTPDLVVLDIHMPHLSGIDLCDRLKKVRRLQNTKVLLVTAHSDDKVQEQAKWVKADKVLEKPLNMETFQGEVKRLLNTQRVTLASPHVSALVPL